MELRDPIHGFVRLDDNERAIVDHRAFQRLRRIRQLAMADLVYPGAVHHRFEHSIGVCHVAGRLAEHFGLNVDDTRRVRLAALVHDIGHGPFSHVSEDPLAEVNKGWLATTGLARDKIHEQIGIDIVRNLLHADGVMTKSDCQAVCDILDTTRDRKRSIPADIVSGPMDADKMDYLLRDSQMCGVKYGVFDLERLAMATVVIQDGDERYIGIHEDDVPALDQYIVARTNMHLQVYGHKTRVATDKMLGRAVMAAIEDEDEEIRRAYTYRPNDPAFLEAYLKFDDRRLLDLLSASSSARARKLADRLRDRRLVSRILDLPLNELSDAGFATKLVDKQHSESTRENIRDQLAKECDGIDLDCVFVLVEEAKPIRKTSKPGVPDPNEIKVKTDYSPEPKSLKEVSGFFRDYEYTPRPRLVVYVNIDPKDHETRESCKTRAREALKSLLASGQGNENAQH